MYIKKIELVSNYIEYFFITKERNKMLSHAAYNAINTLSMIIYCGVSYKWHVSLNCLNNGAGLIT